MDTTVVDVPERGRFEIRDDGDRVVGLASYHVDDGHDDASAHRGRPVRGRPGHRDGARRRRPRAPPASAGSTCCPTAPSCGTTSSSTPSTSTSSPSTTGRTSAWRPPTAEPAPARATYAPPVPEGHTLYRLAREQTTLFAGRPGARDQPAGPVRRRRRAARRPRARRGLLLRQAPVRPASAATPCTSTWASTAPSPAAPGTPPPRRGRAADALGGRRPGRRRRVDRPARPDRLRGADPRPRSPRSSPGWAPIPCARAPTAAAATAGIAASRTAIGALLMDQSVLAGVGNVYRAELLFRHGVSPFRPGPRRRRRRCGRRCGPTWSPSCGPASGWAGSSPPAPSTGPAAAAPSSGRTRTTSTGGPGCPAGSAAPRCAPRCMVGRNLYWCPICQAG